MASFRLLHCFEAWAFHHHGDTPDPPSGIYAIETTLQSLGRRKFDNLLKYSFTDGLPSIMAHCACFASTWPFLPFPLHLIVVFLSQEQKWLTQVLTADRLPPPRGSTMI